MDWRRRLRRRSREEQLDAELRFDLEQRTTDKIASGMNPDEARRQALLEFGGVERVKEECRDVHWQNRVESVSRDFRFALRGLSRDRRFTPMAVLALALGIGSATVIYSAFDGVILNTFAFPHADQITTFFIVDQSRPGSGRTTLTLPSFSTTASTIMSFKT